MNIGIFTNNYLPNPYGVSGSVESFRRQFEKMGHKVYVFAPHWKGYHDNNPNVFRYPSLDIDVKFRFPLPIPYSSLVDDKIEKIDLDIIHSQHPNLLGMAAARWAKKKNIPLVFTWHTLYDKYINYVPFLPKKMAAKWVIRNAVKYANKADQIIIPTESVREIIQDWGVSNLNIQAVSTGIEEEMYLGVDGASIRKNYEISENETLLFSVSRLTGEKNVDFHFESAFNILEKNKNSKFMIVGDGYLKDELQEKVRERNLGDRVIFAGQVKREGMKNYYAASDIFVYASKSETQGMIITEAMYFGLPVVAVRATGICNLVENRKTGILVSEDIGEFSEAVTELIISRDLCDNFSFESKKASREKYLSSICTRKMLEVYKESIRRKAGK